MTRVARVNQRPFPIGAVAGFSGGSNNQVLASGSNGETEWTSYVRTISANGSNYLRLPDVNFASGSNILFTFDSPPLGGGSIPSNTLRIHSTGGAGTTLTVEEEDGSPSGTVSTLIFPNNSLTISGSEATIRDVPQAFIGAKAYNSTTQSIGSGAFTAVTFDTEEFDSDGFHSTSANTSRMTIPTGMGGKYLIIGSGNWATSSSGTQRAFRLEKNGSPINGTEMGSLPTTATRPGLVAEAVLDLVAGDYVEMKAYQDTGGNLNFGSTQDSQRSSLQIIKLDSGKVGQGIGAKVWRSTNQTISSASETAIAFDSEFFDTDGFHDTSSNTERLTIPAGLGGKYIVGANVYTTAITDGEWWSLRIRQNGSTGRAAWRGEAITNGNNLEDLVTVLDLVPGDYVEATVESPDGSYSVNSTLSNIPHFWIMRLDSGSIGTFIGTRVHNSGTQSIGTATWTALTFDSERYDTDAFHSTSANTERFTIPSGLGGKYSIHANIGFAANTTGQRGVRIRLNDTTTIAQDLRETMSDGALGTRMAIACDYDLAAADYIECEVWQDTGGNLNSEVSANAVPEFSLAKLP